jgi:hypothetical protein
MDRWRGHHLPVEIPTLPGGVGPQARKPALDAPVQNRIMRVAAGRRPPSWLAYAVSIGAGLGFGFALAATAGTKDEPLWQVWQPLALAQGGTAGAVLVYGWRRWRELAARRPVSLGTVWKPVVAVALAGLALINLTPVDPDGTNNWRSAATLSSSVVAGVPIATVMFSIRELSVRACATASSLGVAVRDLIDLRLLLQRLLTVVGGFLALTTLDVSALLAVERSAGTEIGERPPEYVLIYGAVGTLLVALTYVPAWASLRDEGLRLRDDQFALGEFDDVERLVDVVEARSRFEVILQIDRPLLSTLRTDLIIFTPLLASAFAAFLTT